MKTYQEPVVEVISFTSEVITDDPVLGDDSNQFGAAPIGL